MNKITGSFPPIIGIIYGGICWQKTPWEEIIDNFELIDSLELSLKKKKKKNRLFLDSFDIIIVPWAPDQLMLKKNRNEIKEFLEKGGIILAFGEFDENWLPSTHWRSELINEIKIVRNHENIFHELNDEKLCNWDDTAHGWFTGLDEEIEIIALGVDSKGKDVPIAFIDNKSYKGTVLCMSIDADFHSYNGIESAKVLLKNCLNWALETYYKSSRSRKHKNFYKRLKWKNDIYDIVLELAAHFILGILGLVIFYFIIKIIFK